MAFLSLINNQQCWDLAAKNSINLLKSQFYGVKFRGSLTDSKIFMENLVWYIIPLSQRLYSPKCLFHQVNHKVQYFIGLTISHIEQLSVCSILGL